MPRTNVREAAVAELQQNLGYRFKDRAFLDHALTHVSVSQGRDGARSYERYEFLGDRVLGLVVAEHLMKSRKGADEGQLTRHFHVLVDRTACARMGRAIGISAALRMAGGESKSGLRDNDTVLGDAMEAVLAAIYLDGGLDAARKAIMHVWADDLAKPPPSSAEGNPKLALQAWAQQSGRPVPTYDVVSRSGPDHAPNFTVRVAVEGVEPLTETGSSRQAAEKAAATAMLRREGLA